MCPTKIQRKFCSKISKFCLLITTLLNMTLTVNAEHSQESSLDSLVNIDAQFWDAYNNCDTNKLSKYLKKDVEFYHDKEGILLTSEKLLKTIQTALCADSGIRLRREPVDGSQSLYPIEDVGAIMTGEHSFFIRNAGGKERPDARAKYTHIWLYDAKGWKLSRILSFDHNPIPFTHRESNFSVPVLKLKSYTGNYILQQMGKVTISLVNDVLLLQTEGLEKQIHPESPLIFYVKDMPLTFHFEEDENGSVIQFDVFENNKKVDQANRVK